MEKIGAGPKGLEIRELTRERVGPKLVDLMENPAYKRAAADVARRMAAEDFEDELCRMVVEAIPS